jgi:hypothetical protein
MYSKVLHTFWTSNSLLLRTHHVLITNTWITNGECAFSSKSEPSLRRCYDALLCRYCPCLIACLLLRSVKKFKSNHEMTVRLSPTAGGKSIFISRSLPLSSKASAATSSRGGKGRPGRCGAARWRGRWGRHSSRRCRHAVEVTGDNHHATWRSWRRRDTAATCGFASRGRLPPTTLLARTSPLPPLGSHHRDEEEGGGGEWLAEGGTTLPQIGRRGRADGDRRLAGFRCRDGLPLESGGGAAQIDGSVVLFSAYGVWSGRRRGARLRLWRMRAKAPPGRGRGVRCC